MAKKSEIVDVDDVTLKHQTDKAYMFESRFGKDVWVPKSMVEWDGETLTLPRTLAEEKGLV